MPRSSTGKVKLRAGGEQLGFTVPKLFNKDLMEFINQDFICSIKFNGNVEVTFRSILKRRTVKIGGRSYYDGNTN